LSRSDVEVVVPVVVYLAMMTCSKRVPFFPASTGLHLMVVVVDAKIGLSSGSKAGGWWVAGPMGSGVGDKILGWSMGMRRSDGRVLS
jgi:hypothetical protein